MNLELENKIVIVTGGSSNIGRAITFAFVKAGSHVIIADIDENQGNNTKKDAEKLNPKVKIIYIKTDVTDIFQVSNMIEKTINLFGKIDIFINNVGWTIDRLFIEKDRKEWEKEIQLNLWSVINCLQIVIPIMIKQKNGSIVSISSDAGRIGEYREAVYSACKAGIIALTKSLAKEVGKYQIRLNVVCPGLTIPTISNSIGSQSMWNSELKNIFTPEVLEKIKKSSVLKQLGTAEDTANATLFLASNAAKFITGQTLSVSGGYSML
jgi:2-hydroxycyclohexanecarboxyl-CoA dehydrogenase